MSRLDDELKAMLVNLPSDEDIRRETGYAKISKALTGVHVGRVAPNKGMPSKNKGTVIGMFTNEHKENISLSKKGVPSSKKGKPMSRDAKEKMSVSFTKYIFETPKGIFNSRKDLLNAFSEHRPEQLGKWCKDGKNGFSRKLKDE